MIGCLRNVFDVAPAGELTYMPVKKKLLQLPSRSQFDSIVHHIRTKAGKGRIAADLVEGLAYSGLRFEEGGGLLWQDLDHERGMITVHGTKTEGSARQIPMIDAFSRHVSCLKQHREQLVGRAVLPAEKVLKAGKASTSLANACQTNRPIHDSGWNRWCSLRDLLAGGVCGPAPAEAVG